MNQEAVFSIFQGSILAIIFLVIAYLLSYLYATWSNFQDEQDSQEETEANAMACPPVASSDNPLAHKHTHCCCKRAKQPDIPAKRPKHHSEH